MDLPFSLPRGFPAIVKGCEVLIKELIFPHLRKGNRYNEDSSNDSGDLRQAIGNRAAEQRGVARQDGQHC